MVNPKTITTVEDAKAAIAEATAVLQTLSHDVITDREANRAAAISSLSRATFQLRRAAHALDENWANGITPDDKAIAALVLAGGFLGEIDISDEDASEPVKLTLMTALRTAIGTLSYAAQMLNHKPLPVRPVVVAPDAWHKLGKPEHPTMEALLTGQDRQLTVIKSAVAKHYGLSIKSLSQHRARLKGPKRDARVVAIHLAILWTHASPARLQKHFGGDLGRAIHVARIISDKIWKLRDINPEFSAEIVVIQNTMFATAAANLTSSEPP